MAPEEQRRTEVANTLTQDEIDALGFFLRDITEIRASRFCQHNAFSLNSHPERLETIPAEFIKAFFVVFRRMYMAQEKGNFVTACDIVAPKVNTLIGDIIRHHRDEYQTNLNSTPRNVLPFVAGTVSFTTKELIDAFLYTKIAHQPQPRSIARWKTFVAQVGTEVRLEFLLYMSVMTLLCHIVNAAGWIEQYRNAYEQLYGFHPTFPDAGFIDNPSGRGVKLTASEALAQRKNQAVQKLARKLMEQKQLGYDDALQQAKRILEGCNG
jgi:hypothetical protein